MENEQNSRKYYEDICDSLQHEITDHTDIEIRLKEDYRAGYIHGCEDFLENLEKKGELNV